MKKSIQSYCNIKMIVLAMIVTVNNLGEFWEKGRKVGGEAKAKSKKNL